MIRSRNEIPLTSRGANYMLVLVAWNHRQCRGFNHDDPPFNRSTIAMLYPNPRHVLPSLPPPPLLLFSIFQPAPEFARFYFQISLARNSPRNCCHFSRKRAIMQAKPACKHFIFQPVAFLPFETPESGCADPLAFTISKLLKFLLRGMFRFRSNCYFSFFFFNQIIRNLMQLNIWIFYMDFMEIIANDDCNETEIFVLSL